MLLQRNVTGIVDDFLESFRAVILSGPRQSGKTTLVRDLLDVAPESQVTFDNEGMLQRALADPLAFVNELPRPAVVDEFQRAGTGFLLAVKQVLDRNRERGQLLLTGSANYLANRSVSETLAGRVGRVALWPLSTGERRGVRETFVDLLFEPEAWPEHGLERPSRADLVHWILEGGYPEVVTGQMTERRRNNWFEAYVQDVVSREAVRPLAEVRLEDELRRVLRLVSARTAQEFVQVDLINDAQLNRETVANYVSLLEALYLVQQIPPWSPSAATRATRRSKVVIADTGLAASVIGAGEADFRVTADGRVAGALYETFVINEVSKQLAWSERSIALSHYRDRNGPEVDLIVEDRRSGQIAGLEIKLTATPRAQHVRHLAGLRDQLGDRFTVGLLVHAGDQVLPMGPRLWAVPVSALWRAEQVTGAR